MASHNSKPRFRAPLAPLILASSLVGGVAACSLTSDPPAVTQVPPTISAQAPEAAVQGSESIAFYYGGVKTSVTVKDAAILFAACTLNTSDTTKIVGFVNNTLKAGPIKDSDVTGLGDPLKPAISDFTGDGTVDCKDAAVLFAVATLGTEAPAAKVNGFLSGTLKLPEVNVTQTQLDTLFKTPATPIPTPIPTPTPTCVQPPSDMVAWWPLDETSGTTAADIAGFPNNGTHVNGPTPVSGKVAGALRFDGVNDHVLVPNHAELDVGTGNFTLDAWVRTGSSDLIVLVDKRSGPTPLGYSLFLVNGRLGFQMANGVGSPSCAPTPTPGHACVNYVAPTTSNVADGQWHHVAAVVDRADATSGVRLYVDGVQVFAGSPLTGNLDNQSDLYLGVRTPAMGGTGFFPGDLDEVELFKRALTQQEIQAIFNAGSAGKCKTPSPKAEICIFKFNDLNGNGQKEANEPPLAGWQFNVNPAPLPPSTNPVTTGQQGGRCFGVSAPGTYTITESVQAGWTPTTSNPQTVNISPGQLVNVYFGNQRCAPPPSGMVAWYWMDGNAYDTAALGGYNNPSATNAISFVAGKDGQGVTFGSGGYIDIPHSSALANQQFTIDAWVKPQGPGPNNDFWGSVIVQKGVSPPTGYTNVPISLWWSAQQQKFGFTFGNMGMDEIVSSSTFPAGQWYHVAATYDGSAMKLYVNGNLEASKPFTSSITYDRLIPWTIGSTAAPIRAAGYPRTFNGVIDEVEIFNRALSQAEIQAIYKSGKCKFEKVSDPSFNPN
jgi:hypothetical protein